MSFYPDHLPPAPDPSAIVLTGEARDIAWAQYWQARRGAYVKVPLGASEHILWLLVTVFTCGLGVIPWIFKASSGRRVVRPGVTLPVWPPPGYIDGNARTARK